MSIAVSAWLDGVPTADCWTLDRGLHYGDGLFETMLLRQGGIRFSALHAARLDAGCRRLGIRYEADSALAAATALAGGAPALLKLIVTRGSATRRGYAPSGTEQARQLLLRYPLPPEDPPDVPTQVVHLAARLGENRLLAGLKHLNRLELVMARAEMQDSTAFEGLLMSSSGQLVCGTQSNVFLVQDGVLHTPRVDRCGIAGVLRAVVLREAGRLGLDARESDLEPADLDRAEEVFLTSVRLGVRAVTSVQDRSLPIGPITRRLRQQVASLDA